ncbi:DUF6602 domain-containing protein [Priestia aryabhattai]|uniref:DUF6602 domain-containing protein n=1 Tax=Priestia aryabhattai TaxID=412384 RepID=UPI003D28EBF2
MNLLDIFQGISHNMKNELENLAVNKAGLVTENTIKKFLQKHLPSKYSIGSGHIISHNGQNTGQLDCIVFDHSSCPVLYNERFQVLPSESVCAVLEIKSKLNINSLESALQIICRVKELPKLNGERLIGPNVFVTDATPETFGAIFALETNTTLEILRNRLNLLNKDIDHGRRISILCILNQGVLMNVNKHTKEIDLIPNENSVIASVKTTNDTLLLFFLLLSSYLNQIEVVPPNLTKYLQNYLNQINIEIG